MKRILFANTLALAFVLCGFVLRPSIPIITTGNQTLCATQAFGAVFPSGSFFCLNNTFGVGSLVNGTDFQQSVSIQTSSTFPVGTVMQWKFPNAPNGCTGCGGFAYGYPEIFYGKGEFSGSNPYKMDGPWFNTVVSFTGSISSTTLTVSAIPANSLAVGQMIYTPFGASFSAVSDGTLIVNQLTGTTGGVGTYTVSNSQSISSRAMSAVTGKTINQLANLTATYNITLRGNLSSFDTLIDLYFTNDFIGTIVLMELSFFPQNNFIPGLVATTCHTFTFGEALVGIQPSGVQVLVLPTSGSCTANRTILAGIGIDYKEIYAYLVTRSAAFHAANSGFAGITGAEYPQGFQFGIETQVPAVYNSGPYQGSMVVNNLSYVWNFLLRRDLLPAANDNSPAFINQVA